MKKFAVLMILLLLVVSLPAAAVDRLVPSTYSTIQAAVSASNDGDRVLVSAGTYNESIAFPAGLDNLTIEGVEGEAINVWPDGTVAGAGRDAIYFNNGTNLTVKNIFFFGTTDTHVGILTGVGSTLTVEDCEFAFLSTAIAVGGTPLTGLTITDCIFRSPRANCGVSGSTWAVYGSTTPLTITGSSFDTSNVTPTDWYRGIFVRGAGSYFANNSFISDAGASWPLLNVYQTTSDIVVEHNYFETAAGAGFKVGNGAVANQTINDVVVRYNRFHVLTTGRGIHVERATSDTTWYYDWAVYGNRFTTANAGAANGAYLVGLSRANVHHNTFVDFALANSSGLQVASCRRMDVSANTFLNCDNGFVIAANGVIAQGNSYDVSCTGNYFQGDGEDGAIKIDNELSSATVWNDTLLTIAGNGFVDVEDLFGWVEWTGSVTYTYYQTLATYQANAPGLQNPTPNTLSTIGSWDATDGLGAGRGAGIVPPVVQMGGGNGFQ